MRTKLFALISLTLLAAPAGADEPGGTPAQPPDAAPPAAPAPPPASDSPTAPTAETPAQAPGETPSRDPAEAPSAPDASAAPTAPGEVRSVSAANIAPRAPGSSLSAIDLADLPKRCHPIAKRAKAANVRQVLPARISLANCRSDAKLAELELIDGAESIIAIDEAAAPSLMLLDEVIAAGDPMVKVMAHHAKAQLYSGMAMRMLTTVPTATGSTPEAIALRDSRREIVEALINPWRGSALEEHQAVVALAKANPALTRNPVVQTALRDSHARIAQRAIATR